MVLTVVRHYHWQPEVIKNLYLDREDYEGLEFWYEDVKEVIREMKAK